MTAPHTISEIRDRASRSVRPRARTAFTLTELLIVIAIIVLLVSLLLAAMSQVQAKGRETRTLATMQAFGNACDAFQQQFGFYPGVVPEAILTIAANQEKLTGTENAVLHMMGGYVREEDVGTESFNDDYAPADGWTLTRFDTTDPDTAYRIKINTQRIGEGPTINGKPFAPFLSPGDDEFGLSGGQLGDLKGGTAGRVPEILDAWGQPIIYLRRIRSVGPLTSPDELTRTQFNGNSMIPYCDSMGLGRLGRQQLWESGTPSGSVLSAGATDAYVTLGKLLEHSSLPGQARGSYLLLSAGKDGIYLSAEDGPGAPGAAINDVGAQIELGTLPPTIFDEYDDVIHFGGG